VRREIDALAGKGAGYSNARRLLGIDPCAEELAAYRLSGPLAPIVCGVQLKRGYRLAFTTQPPLAPAEDDRLRVVILYVGKREPRHRDSDVWTLLHDLFGVDYPPSGHHKPACCTDQLPEIDQDQLDGFIASLRRLQRGR
jgi:hypothetical protein